MYFLKKIHACVTDCCLQGPACMSVCMTPRAVHVCMTDSCESRTDGGLRDSCACTLQQLLGAGREQQSRPPRARQR